MTNFQLLQVVQQLAAVNRLLFCGSLSKELQAKDTQHRITYLYEAHVDNLESQLLLFRRLRTATGEYVCRSLFCSARFRNAWFSLELVPLLAVSVSHEK